MGLLDRVTTAFGPKADPAYKAHVLERIAQTEPGTAPFRHLYVENVLPEADYAAMHAAMLERKARREGGERAQDNPEFKTPRHSILDDPDPVLTRFRAVFADRDVKRALASKFYIDPKPALVDALRFHKRELEFVFSPPGRFQNIHVDVPGKYLSLVFYFPDGPVTPEQEAENATVLYNDAIEPVHAARYRQNSVCVFAPHFHSYHGFATTRERDALVMFYINPAEHKLWRRVSRDEKDVADGRYTAILDRIEDKLTRHPLIEIGASAEEIAAARAASRINAPQGRVMID